MAMLPPKIIATNFLFPEQYKYGIIKKRRVKMENKDAEEMRKDLIEAMGTMQVMIYSLKQAIDDILEAMGATKKELADTNKWEEECRKVARELYLKEDDEDEVH